MAKKYSRIILVGPTCSGKNYLRTKYINRGYSSDVSYTTRRLRKNEVRDVDYHYISEKKFNKMIDDEKFYEHIKYDGIYYGTGLKEWNSCEIFIMETIGISKLTPLDRKKCFIIYLNPERMIREARMRKERKWSNKKIDDRAKQDFIRFVNFDDYDMIVTNSEF